jgi:4-hydroxy-3-polyprenylbenzoate decarboxylase
MLMGNETRAGGRPAVWRDTREWLERVDAIGQLQVVRGVGWEEEIGAVTEMLDHTDGSPAVIFDEIPGYPAGFRVLVNASGSPARQAVTLSLPPEEGTHEGLNAFWRRTLDGLKPIPPREVESGPILENVLEGDEVDLYRFPTPHWHAQDGGRYIGTASMNILKDPDSDWVNIGTYRNQIFSRNELGIFISPGKHGRLIREKYFDRGERCPIVVMVGADPLLFMASATSVAYGQSELGWAGAVRDEPIDFVRGKHTGLPIPATAEIAIEGWIDPGEVHDEGPYGEFHGYYAGGAQQTPVIHVAAIYHRNDPILIGCPQGKPPHEDNRFGAYVRSIQLETELRAAGVPGVVGAWCPPEAAERLLAVVAIDQKYPGHATQALLVASQCSAIAYINRMVVVVDPDIDLRSVNDVVWAILTRADPERDTTIVRRGWSGPLDSAIPHEKRGFNSRLLIDATRPWEWRERFAEPVTTAERERSTREEWGWILDGDPSMPRE